MFSEKLDEDKIKKIINGSATILEFENIKKKIDDRFCYIINKISEIIQVELDWFDYDNLGEGEEDNGYFDPKLYSNKIGIVYYYKGGSYKGKNFELYDNSIPIEFLWSDFEDIVLNEFNKFKSDTDLATLNEKIKKESQDKKLKEIIEQVKSKLTKEELSYIVFKKPK